eukprot:scaffold126730_cov18-Prasinocladus_malaysianus.AAC.1
MIRCTAIFESSEKLLQRLGRNDVIAPLRVEANRKLWVVLSAVIVVSFYHMSGQNARPCSQCSNSAN